MRLLVDHTDQKEQRARAETVIDHLQDRALHALRVERKQTEHHKTEVAHGGIRHQFLHICLGVGNRRPVNDADGRQEGDPRRRLDGGFGEERDVEAQETIGPQFQQDTCQNDGTGGRRFHVSVGQPGMQGPHRHFDRKCRRERQEQPYLCPGVDANPNQISTENVPPAIPSHKIASSIRMEPAIVYRKNLIAA